MATDTPPGMTLLAHETLRGSPDHRKTSVTPNYS